MKAWISLFLSLLTLSLMLSAALASGAAAAVQHESNPGQYCAQNDNTVTETFGGESFPLPVPSRGGCASSVATGQLSQSAFIAQCKQLQQELPPELFNAPVDIEDINGMPTNVGGFGGKISTCAYLLRGYHNGTLFHPE